MKKRKKTKKNFGFIPPVVTETDFWLGSKKLGSEVINPSGDWRGFLPILEHQNKGFETSACISFGTLSALEMIHKLLYSLEPNYSDRFLAKMSGTDPAVGNNPKTVSDTLRHNGMVSEATYPMTSTLSEYYQEIPQSVRDIGLEWLKNYGFGYEYTDDLREGLKRSPVGVAVQAWYQNSAGEYVRKGASNHWCVLVAFDNDRPIIWDSYDSGLKTLAKGYQLEFAQIYTLKKKESLLSPELSDYKAGNHYLNMLKRVWKFLIDLWYLLF